ncbi:hypothetical protein LX97_03334 [Nonlabens dokdonensis]|jgi:CO dehydrogenase/acetyl-CoA synthase epsilon subunit|uniref:Uncharacterized protein n=2 Tax=Nonlabens dokdonensis TaxID=328515 RepID=L7WAR9_NONDD|nr:hypothetical protein [Nonlabens dokdonensis]AGC76966.1 hypothetical protein DDD_1838 [Nonlabens dokdonensis DSW-6]PZX36869.1 hypothetical protein LX97_03334 [Nonlabens dokdonensis]
MGAQELKEYISENIKKINDKAFLEAIKTLVENKQDSKKSLYSDENIEKHVTRIMKDNHELLKRLAE